jgi:hypothetical protein
MKIISFSEVGNLGDYKLEHQRVKNYDLLVTPKLVLKLYQMTTQRCFEPEKMEVTKNFLEKEIKRRAISPLTGMGFAIQSKDMLNVVRWDTQYPILMKNILYGFEEPTLENVAKKEYNGLFDKVEKLNINKVGPFCIWEDTIVAHERAEWIRYLHSKRTEADKRVYFSSFINGLLV